METVAPLSLLLVGLVGVLVMVGAIARIVVAERRQVAARIVVPAWGSPVPPVTGEGIAA